MMFHMLDGNGPFPAKTMDQLKDMVCTSKPIVNPGEVNKKRQGFSTDCVDCVQYLMTKS